MNRYIQNIFVAFILSLVNMGIAQDKLKVDGVVAVVGKSAIFKSDIQKQVIQYKMQNPQQEYQGDLYCIMLEQLMYGKLLSHQAIEDSIEVKETQIQDAVKRRFEMLVSRIGSIKKLEEFYKKSREDIKDQMYDVIGNQLLSEQMQQKIISKVDVTPYEVKSFFESIPKDKLPQVGTQVKLSQIVIYPKMDKKTKQETIEKLNSIRQDILDGSSFKTKAVLYSQDPGSSRKGGEYKGVKRGQFVKPFEAIAFNLDEGEISEPFETQFGYHIVQLQKRKGDELDLRHILIKHKVSEESLQEAKAYIDSIRAIVVSKYLTFKQAVKEFSQDETSKINDGIVVDERTKEILLELSSMESNISSAIGELEIGQVSEPIYRETRDKKMYVIYMVKDKIDAHTIDYVKDYSKVKTLAIRKKQEKTSSKWMKDKIKETYIRLTDEVKQCKFKQDWEKSKI